MIVRMLVAALLVAIPASAEVVRIEVKSRTPVLAGQPFGTVGPYERLSGTIHFAIDPRNSANLIIADIDKAPRNAAGKVEFTSDFYLLKPVDPARGNGTVLYEVSNRGGKGMVGFFNFAAGRTKNPDGSERPIHGYHTLPDGTLTPLYVIMAMIVQMPNAGCRRR